ncbi:MAG: D-alanyl-D-alanine carboxypeptidase [Clostridia bacterium]|nr:D-alanyl-D-alanine carboxypeptidase [Clostridia bacterium]
MRKRIYVFFIVCAILICLSSTSIGAYVTIPVWSENAKETINQDESKGNFLELDCGSAILIEQNTGEVLYSHNEHEKLRPASVTKVMTILLIMEAINNGNLKYEDKIPCSENASSMGGSQIWLDTNEELTVDEMLKAICVVSANDCTVAMAEKIGGSEENFVNMMNDKARELGMKDTTFKNCHGIDEDDHVTSAYDISLMSRELLTKYPEITNYTTIYMDSLRNGESELVNTNKIIRNYAGATGLKTGSTSLALFNLSASATREGMSLIGVIMKAPTSKERFSCARKLLDYGFSNYKYETLSNENDFVKDIKVQKGVKNKVNLLYDKTLGKITKSNEQDNIETIIDMKDSIDAPVQKNQVIGKVTFKRGEEILGETNLITGEEIKKQSVVNMISEVYEKWFKLLR